MSLYYVITQSGTNVYSGDGKWLISFPTEAEAIEYIDEYKRKEREQNES
jgi:hypothetical protein